MTGARSIHIKGVVQGVGFRPFLHRLARANALHGWVLNANDGVELHVEGPEQALDTFLRDVQTDIPPSARISCVEVQPAIPTGFQDFTIRPSDAQGHPSTRISPDLPICEDCLRELFDPTDCRYQYSYINCTNCGPRYSVIERLPYDRPNTTMKSWPLDETCERQYQDPANRRFHAQPVACPSCGPGYDLRIGDAVVANGEAAIASATAMLNEGAIVAIKGIGGYHLACDATDPTAVSALRERKFRKEQPFAVMARDLNAAHRIVELTQESRELLTSTARPIVLVPATADLPGVAPGNHELGVMLPYAPLHYMLFAVGAPNILVMTSANRSSEPIAYQDSEAIERLTGIADAFLIGERPIARRVDDSVARNGAFGPVILRRSRGYAPGAVATLPFHKHPILATGADLKNTITIVVDGQAFVSQHIGDLEHHGSRQSFRDTIRDLCTMYEIKVENLIVAHDLHRQYFSTLEALELDAPHYIAIQHHRSHIASVLAERSAWEERVLGISFDGTGYGDDGTIWGGEFFVGGLTDGLRRILHLRPADLPGGDAAARFPVQAAAGFLKQLDYLPDLTVPPFNFPDRYRHSQRLADAGIQAFRTTSVGRLFDTAAALLGFTREITFEGQAAIWLEQLGRTSHSTDSYPFPIDVDTLDFRQLLNAVISDRINSRPPHDIARAFIRGIGRGVSNAIKQLSEQESTSTAVLSGGVFQNQLLLSDIQADMKESAIRIWTNSLVPPNDGGISLGQAAIAALEFQGAFESKGMHHA